MQGKPPPGWIYTLALGTNLAGDGRSSVSLMMGCGQTEAPATAGKRSASTPRSTSRSPKRLRWSGAVKPENGNHYEPPYPPDWFRPVHASFDLNLKITATGGFITGTARLSGPRLPCPVLRHIKPNRP